jgi:glycosyltransferase involved in cell wall biosynthesis
MTERHTLLIIGPTPPPYHGVAMAIQTLLTSRLTEEFEVTHLELADRRGIAHVNKPDLHDVVLFIRQWVRLLWMLLTERPHLVYLVLSQTTIGFLRDSLLIWPSYLFGSRVIVHLHGGNLREWYDTRWFPVRAYVRLVLGAIKKVIVLGNSLKPVFSGLVEEDRLAVVSNGIDDVCEHRPDHSVRSHSRWRVLHLNTLNRMKGTMVLLAAIPAILRSRTDVEFIFAGPWSDPGQQEAAEVYIAQHGIGSFITFTGQVTGPEKQALLQSADLFVFPGVQQEGQPLVVLEAMAAGLPVVFTDRGCLRETVGEGECGIETYTFDPFDLAERIRWLLNHPEEMRRLGANARRRYETHYTKERHVGRMIEVLTAVDPPIKSAQALRISEAWEKGR